MRGLTARQPILDGKKNIIGYELLHRELDLLMNGGVMNGERATSYILLNIYFDNKLKEISDNKTVFINFPNEDFLKIFIDLKPNPKIVIEVLETFKPTPELLNTIKQLSDLGHRLALDDFDYNHDWYSFMPYFDIIKIDFRAHGLSFIKAGVEKIKKYGNPKLVAEKIETEFEFKWAKDHGFNYFQGFFFARPQLMRFKDKPCKSASAALFYFEVSKKELDFNKITEIIKLDLSLAYRFVNYVNNIFDFDGENEIKSIRGAVFYAGELKIRQFLNMLIFSKGFVKKPIAIHKLAIQRAKFCELLSRNIPSLNLNHECANMLGLFSCLDGLLDEPMVEIMRELNIDKNIKMALNGDGGKYGVLINFIDYYESGNWVGLDVLMKEYNISSNLLNDVYMASIEWSNDKD